MFPDNSEALEEFDVKTQTLLARKWRRPNVLGNLGQWTYEVGEDTKANAEGGISLAPGLRLSADTPSVLRRDTDDFFTFAIRHMPWPMTNYDVTVNQESGIIVRTKNRKYYGELQIPDLARYKQKYEASLLNVQHHNDTLIIAYRKPIAILNAESKAREERKKNGCKEGDVQCNTQ